MELSELTAYASETYHIQEQHKWADFPGFSVLCHPQTGKWVALLMRQWDSETGTQIERCDLKCGCAPLLQLTKPFLTPPLRMHGLKWLGVRFGEKTEREVVLRLFDQAVAEENRKHLYELAIDKALSKNIRIDLDLNKGATIILDSASAESPYRETPLPIVGSPLEREEIPDKLRQMKRLYEYSWETTDNRARNFYRQGKLMEDYADDMPWAGDFHCYYPTYHDLSIRQLRGYFTWRTQLRKGVFQPIPVSAAYLYLYELLNGIGAPSAEERLQKLGEFERGYLDAGLGDARMRQNLHAWILELAILHSLPPALTRQYADPELLRRDEALATLQAPMQRPDGEIFSALCFFGGQKLSGSPVVTGDPERAARLLAAVWKAASEYRRNGKRLFALCFGRRRTRRWYPLENAVYYRQDRPKDRVYELDNCRSYRCKGGVWYCSDFDKRDFDRTLFQGLLHETERRLRLYLHIGRALKENPADAWAAPYIDAVIEADKKAVQKAARPKITIDLSGLEKIRRDAAGTRDSLLTEEELDEPEALVKTPEEENASALGLDPVQIQILRALLRGEDVTKLLKANHLMPSMAADFINEALFDEIGDTVVACEDDRLTLIEDYSEDLAQLLGGTNHG